MGVFSRLVRPLIQTRRLARIRDDRGEAMSYLVLIIGLVAAAAVGATTVGPMVGDLVGKLGDKAGVEVAAGEPEWDGAIPGGPGDATPDGPSANGGSGDVPDGPVTVLGGPGDGPVTIPGGPGDATPDGPSANGGPDNPGATLPEPGFEPLEDWDFEDFNDELEQAFADGDFERVEELKAIFLEGIDDLDAEAVEALFQERHPFLPEGQGDGLLFLLLATSEDGTTNPHVLARLGALGEDIYRAFNYSLQEREYLAEHFDFSEGGEDIPDQIVRKLYEDAAANGSLVEMVLAGGQRGEVPEILAEVLAAHVQENPETLVAAAESGVLLDVINDFSQQPEVREILSEALYERLFADPDLLAEAAYAARRDAMAVPLQDLLEAVAVGNSDAALDVLVTASLVSGAADLQELLSNEPDPAKRLEHPAVLEFAGDIGQLLYQIDEIGSQASFDPTGLVFLGLKEIPVAGDAFKVIEKLFGGYTGDQTYQTLEGEDLETRNLQLAAFAVAAASDPSVVPQLEVVLDNLEAGMSLSDAWGDNDLLEAQVSQIQTTIENGNNTTSSN